MPFLYQMKDERCHYGDKKLDVVMTKSLYGWVTIPHFIYFMKAILCVCIQVNDRDADWIMRVILNRMYVICLHKQKKKKKKIWKNIVAKHVIFYERFFSLTCYYIIMCLWCFPLEKKDALNNNGYLGFFKKNSLYEFISLCATENHITPMDVPHCDKKCAYSTYLLYNYIVSCRHVWIEIN